MDKNIVALVREDTKTVNVRFFSDKFRSLTEIDGAVMVEIGGIKQYKYVTTMELEPGDLCMVFVGTYPAVVEIQSIDENLSIEPNAPTYYKWIACKLDLSYYETLKKQNTEFQAILEAGYRTNARRQFREVLLQSVDSETQARLASVIKGDSNAK